MSEDTSELLKIADKLTDLVQRLAGPMADELGQMLGDKVRVYRVKNWINTVQKTGRLLREARLSANAVPPRLLLPIIESSSVEDNDSLQDLWAGLLATASQETDAVSPSFIETLKQLTPAEARYIDELYRSADDFRRARPSAECPIDPRKFSEHWGAPAGVSAETFERLGLIQRDYNVKLDTRGARRRSFSTIDDAYDAIENIEPEIQYRFVFTKYAFAFLDACHGPGPQPVDEAEAREEQMKLSL